MFKDKERLNNEAQETETRRPTCLKVDDTVLEGASRATADGCHVGNNQVKSVKQQGRRLLTGTN